MTKLIYAEVSLFIKNIMENRHNLKDNKFSTITHNAKQKNTRLFYIITLILSIYASIFTVAIVVLYEELVYNFSIFFMPLIYFFFAVTLFASIITSVVFILLDKPTKIRSSIPLWLVIATISIIFVAPIREMKRDMNFEKLLPQRLEVVEYVIGNEVIINTGGLISLPQKYKKTSDSGQILLCQKNDEIIIYFFTNRGLLESSSGYIYFTQLTVENKDYTTQDFKIIKNLGKGWAYISTY